MALAERLHRTRSRWTTGRGCRLTSVPGVRQHLPLLEQTTTGVVAPAVPDLHRAVRHRHGGGCDDRAGRTRETGAAGGRPQRDPQGDLPRDGGPLYVSSNIRGEQLGAYLVARGAITSMELDMALAVLPRYQGNMADALLALEAMDPMALFEQLTEHVRLRLLDLFTWRSGVWMFFRGVKCQRDWQPPAATPAAARRHRALAAGPRARDPGGARRGRSSCRRWRTRTRREPGGRRARRPGRARRARPPHQRSRPARKPAPAAVRTGPRGDHPRGGLGPTANAALAPVRAGGGRARPRLVRRTRTPGRTRPRLEAWRGQAAVCGGRGRGPGLEGAEGFVDVVLPHVRGAEQVEAVVGASCAVRFRRRSS
ncbi:MAG: hypothetical protein MZV63_56590 [Marinilabiliales bacterium]|nr:hypothetical protein [Marinilabiliales bacterium]